MNKRNNVYIVYVMLLIISLILSGCTRGPDEPSLFEPAGTSEATPTPIETPLAGEQSAEDAEVFNDSEVFGEDITPETLPDSENDADTDIGTLLTEEPDEITPAPTETIESGDELIPYKRFSDPDLGIASHAPAEWKMADGETSITFTMEMPTFAPRVMVMVTPLTDAESAMALKDLTSKASANLNSKYASFKLADETVSVLLEQESLEYTFSGTYNEDILMRGRLAFTSRDGKLYIIQYVTAEADFAAYENVFRRVREKLVIE